MNKKGISIIVGYVLLIVIAMSLGLLVYSWLKGYIPKETKECPQDVALIIADYNCNPDNDILNLSLSNKGFFNIDGFIIKAANKTGLATLPLKEMNVAKELGAPVIFPGDKGLKPNEESVVLFSYTGYEKILSIEIIPFNKIGYGRILCNEAIITQDLEGCI